MKPHTFARELICSRCGEVNKIIDQPDFSDLCRVLMTGRSGLIVCRKCGLQEIIRFTGDVLELVD